MALAAKKEDRNQNSRRGFLAGLVTILGLSTGMPAYADGSVSIEKKFPIVGSENLMS